jgi:hypothetical protein
MESLEDLRKCSLLPCFSRRKIPRQAKRLVGSDEPDDCIERIRSEVVRGDSCRLGEVVGHGNV